jgi:hypothetical protein
MPLSYPSVGRSMFGATQMLLDYACLHYPVGDVKGSSFVNQRCFDKSDHTHFTYFTSILNKNINATCNRFKDYIHLCVTVKEGARIRKTVSIWCDQHLPHAAQHISFT